MTRPLLLLDVDGVLNPYGYSSRPTGFTDHRLFPEDDDPVLVNAEHGIWITELTRVYDVTWATGWNDNANRLLAPLLGIAPLPVLTMPPIPFHPSGKVPIVARLARHRPTAWIDDLHTPQAHTWADNRPEPTLLITIDPSTGLTRGSIDQALVWATNL
ncbi:HAD domain-containing protein [Spirillospora sp. CA-142024]|uniref:HAD domain-containing protein n=1 Tax=Spirillospora sp. CA-142024 TaxID=3240036 RepID=UPI003D947205